LAKNEYEIYVWKTGRRWGCMLNTFIAKAPSEDRRPPGQGSNLVITVEMFNEMTKIKADP
jgi:hypothetical protein